MTSLFFDHSSLTSPSTPLSKPLSKPYSENKDPNSRSMLKRGKTVVRRPLKGTSVPESLKRKELFKQPVDKQTTTDDEKMPAKDEKMPAKAAEGEKMSIEEDEFEEQYIPRAEYTNERIETIMKMIKEYYLYLPTDESDLEAKVEKYKTDIMKPIYERILGEVTEKMDTDVGGGKGQEGGDQVDVDKIQIMALYALEYRRILLNSDIKEKRTVTLTLTRINNTDPTKPETEHNVAVRFPTKCFETDSEKQAVIRSQKSKGFKYSILGTKHIYKLNQAELKVWLDAEKAGKEKFEYPQFNTTSWFGKTSTIPRITNLVFRNNILEHEIKDRRIFREEERINEFKGTLSKEEKEQFDESIEIFRNFSKVKYLDDVFTGMQFNPGERGYIIQSIQEFFKKMLDPKEKKTLGQIDKLGVFTANTDDKHDDDEVMLKPEFTSLGVNVEDGEEDGVIEAEKMKIDEEETIEDFLEKTSSKDLLEMINDDLNSLASSEAQIATREIFEQKQKALTNIHEEQDTTYDTDGQETIQEEVDQTRAEVDEARQPVDAIESKKDVIKKAIEKLIHAEKPYTGLWFNLTIPGNHTWILFYINRKFFSIGGGYNNSREYKLTFYSPDPVCDYDNHWLFPLMINNWGFIDKDIIKNLENMAKKVTKKSSEGFITDLKYCMVSNKMTSYLFSMFNCASTADKILGTAIPHLFAYPNFNRGGKYSYTMEKWVALSDEYKVIVPQGTVERMGSVVGPDADGL